MKKILVFALLFFFNLAIANQAIIKVAILDNFHSQKLPSDKYQTFYLQGITLASENAKKQSIKFQYKVFSYGTEPLDILNELPAITKWKPDLVIGPRSSNQFLLLSKHFHDTMILSPYATADTIDSMPKNFYSLTRSNQFSAKAISQYLSSTFPKKNLFVLTQADCKSCTGLAKKVIDSYKLSNPNIKIHQAFFLQNQAQTIDLSKIFKNASLKNSVVLLPNMSYPSGILMVRITNYAKMPMTFIGADDWGDWKDGIVGKYKAAYYYVGYRIVPWAQNDDTHFAKNFFKQYKKKYRSSPDGISFIAYTTLSSVTAAILKYPKICSKNFTSKCIMATYKKALENNPNWFRPKHYYVYKVDTSGEKYLGPVK